MLLLSQTNLLIKKVVNKVTSLVILLILKVNKKSYILLYKISYLRYLLGKNFFNNQSLEEEEKDLVFINGTADKKWILGAISREIAAHFPAKYSFSYDYYYPYNQNIFAYTPVLSPLTPSKTYFFADYSYFAVCLKLYPSLWGSQSVIYYTHPQGLMNDEEFAYVMNKSTKVICMCSQFANRLIDCGVKPEKVTYVLGAADADMFQPHKRSGDGFIGFCTAYYPRKDPDRIFSLVKSMPHRKFLLIGKNWEQYEKFSELKSLANFSYIQARYNDYPKLYAKMDVFISPARLEGGPIPLIESMMCNVVPVASKTGFAPDIITHGENGLLFDVDSPIELICDLVEKAFQIKTNIRETVKHLDWKNFSHNIQQIINLSSK